MKPIRPLLLLASLSLAAPVFAGPGPGDLPLGAEEAGVGAEDGAVSGDEAVEEPVEAIDPAVANSPYLGRWDLDGTKAGVKVQTKLEVLPGPDGTFRVIRRSRTEDGRESVLEGTAVVRRELLLVEFDAPASVEEDVPEDLEPEAPTTGGLIGAIPDLDGAEPVDRPADAGEGRNAPLSIQGSVGKGGVNRPEDVRLIQAALVRRGYLKEGSFTPGRCDAALIAAISRYQKERAGFRWPDGRVDVDNRTLRAMNQEQALWAAGGRLLVIKGSVGLGGVNRPEDVELIQDALVKRGYLTATSFTPGRSDSTLVQAIYRYQRERAGFRTGDGRVDVADRTIRALNREQLRFAPGGEPDAPVAEPAVEEPEVARALDQLPPDAPVDLADPGAMFPNLPDEALIAVYGTRDGRILGACRDVLIGGDASIWTFERGFRHGAAPAAGTPAAGTPAALTPAAGTPALSPRALTPSAPLE